MSCFDIQQNDGWENLRHCCINRRNYELSHYLFQTHLHQVRRGALKRSGRERERVRFIKGLLEEDVVFLREGNKVLTRIPCGHSSFLATLHSNLPPTPRPSRVPNSITTLSNKAKKEYLIQSSVHLLLNYTRKIILQSTTWRNRPVRTPPLGSPFRL